MDGETNLHGVQTNGAAVDTLSSGEQDAFQPLSRVPLQPDQKTQSGGRSVWLAVHTPVGLGTTTNAFARVDSGEEGAAALAALQVPLSPSRVTWPEVLSLDTPLRLELVRVPAGGFWMGSDPMKARERNVGHDEQPHHRVDVAEFYMSKYPVTNSPYAVYTQMDFRNKARNHIIERVQT